MPAVFGLPELISARSLPELEPVTFLVALIAPRQAAKAMACLSEAIPLEGYNHAKRVRKCVKLAQPVVLEVLICPAHEGLGRDLTVSVADDEGAVPVPEAVRQFIDEHSLTTALREVPRHAPATREQWAEWTQLWPLHWNLPSTKASMSEADLSGAEVASMERWMTLALAESEQAERQGSSANAAVLVDPNEDVVVAIGRDATADDPLGHAAMRAVKAAAARNLDRWPEEAAGPPEVEQNQASSSCCPSPQEERAPEKRQKLNASSVVGSDPVLPGLCPDHHGPKLPTERQYLCTGFDCYVVAEPCAMCAMALVHSRVRRVVFCRPDTGRGALGGSFRLHAERSLNHHYVVFRLPLLD